MSEVKPVAWMGENENENICMFSKNKFSKKQGFDEVTGLYTKEQFQHRVNMDANEYREFYNLFVEKQLISTALHFILNTDSYMNLKIWITSQREERERELFELWYHFDPEHYEQTINIVSVEKWFVETENITDDNFKYLRIGKDNLINYYAPKHKATVFNTEEEAKKWETPVSKVHKSNV